MLCFFNYRMDALRSRSNATQTLLSFYMNIQLLYNICERLFDELVKEWLQNRYTIVSGTFRETNGRMVRIRKFGLFLRATSNHPTCDFAFGDPKRAKLQFHPGETTLSALEWSIELIFLRRFTILSEKIVHK